MIGLTVALPSVQALFLNMCRAGARTHVELACGTGFVVQSAAGPLLLTARHNLTGCDQTTGEALHSTAGVPNEVLVSHLKDRNLPTRWERREEPLVDADERPLWIEHPELAERADIAALPLRNVAGVELNPIPLEPPPVTLSPSQTLSVVGFPFGWSARGRFPIWSTGFIASDMGIDYDNLPVFLIDCRSRQGQSGAPVIASFPAGTIRMIDGKPMQVPTDASYLVGLYTGRIRPRGAGSESTDIGMVWKLQALRELVAHAASVLLGGHA